MKDEAKTKEQLQLVLDALPVLVSYVDSEQRYRLNNRAYEEWFGRPRTEVWGKHVKEVLGEPAYETIRKYIEAALSGQKVTYERAVPYKDAGTRYISADYIPHFGENGEVKGFFALVSDITERKRLEEKLGKYRDHLEQMVAERVAELISVNEKLKQEISERKQAEEALKQAEEKYRSLINNVKLGVFRSTPEPLGKFLEVNPAMEEITGYRRKELLQMNVADLYVYPEERRLILEEVALGKGKAAKELRLRKKDGTEIVALDRKVALRDDAGRILYFDGIMEDITEQKEAEEALRAAERNFRHSLDNSPLGIRIIDISAEGDTIYANRAILDIYGYSSIEELKSIPDVERHTPKSYAERQERVRKREAGKPVPDRFEQSIIRKDGEVRNLEVFNREVLWGGKKQFQLIYHDITERKEAEEREKELQKELNLASRLASIGELAAGVAHEINNPLTGILAFSQRLLRKSTDEKVSRDLEIIHNEARRTAKVVENLLTFARRREPKKEYSDVNDILQRALELRAYQLKTGNIEVVTHLAPSLPKTKVDFHQIQEVFLNIILNADQVMTEANRGGKLSIKTREVDGYIRISFTDDGPGISAEYLDKVFDPFFSTRRKRGGTGLGLSICHGIVERHGGKIYAKSQPGKGATFFVELPLTSEKVKEARRS